MNSDITTSCGTERNEHYLLRLNIFMIPTLTDGNNNVVADGALLPSPPV